MPVGCSNDGLSGEPSNDPFFRLIGSRSQEVLEPFDAAASGWGASQVRGMAVSGALARSVENAFLALDRPDVRPVRWTVDMFRAVRMERCRTSARVVRLGRRVCILEATLNQESHPVARATALYLAGGTDPDDVIWSPPADSLAPPPVALEQWAQDGRLHYSEAVGWTASAADHRNSSRKQAWVLDRSIVDGEASSPFQRAASAADVASVVSNCSAAGLAFINADLSLGLVRLPIGSGLGLASSARVAADGVAVTYAVMFDRSGVLGTVMVSALANAARTVDPATRQPAPTTRDQSKVAGSVVHDDA